jgi:hypothetical protein
MHYVRRTAGADGMRQAALRRYIVFRIKAMEFLDLNALRNSLRWTQLQGGKMSVPLPTFPAIRPPLFVSDSLRTVVLSWFCLFIDKKDGMDVIKLWVELFPRHAVRVNSAWERMKSAWPTLQMFRNRAGFHADKPLKFFSARYGVHRESKKVEAALTEFEVLLNFFLNAELKELPDLEGALDALLDDLEKAHDVPYQREQLKAYLMIGDRGTA